MGNKSSSTSIPSNNRSNSIIPRERSRHGVVNVKITSLAYANRRQSDNEQNVVVTPKGVIFHGNNASPHLVLEGLRNSGVPMLLPMEVPIVDSRAHKLLVLYTDSWYVVPSQEPFSRHSGTCLILGSVGVVVSEIKSSAEADEERLDARKLQYLKDDALAFDSEEEMAALAAEEEEIWRQSNDAVNNLISSAITDVTKKSIRVTDLNNDINTDHVIDESNYIEEEDDDEPLSIDNPPNEEFNSPIKTSSTTKTPTKSSPDNYTGGITNGERFVCYMCYETHDTPTDPLVAPCDCKGDTRYLHVQCLQKWYQSSVAGPQARVIRTTGTGAPACKICGSAYKTTFKKPDGKKANLLEMECNGPYISLIVVTRHDTNPGLFNTKFRLNFGRLGTEGANDSFTNSLSVGRSSSCNMVLDYRTVSTAHAKIFYEDGNFFIQDSESSNGTMVYLQQPLRLKYSVPVRIRMGRTTMQLQARRSWTAAIRSILSSSFPLFISNDRQLARPLTPVSSMSNFSQNINIPTDKASNPLTSRLNILSPLELQTIMSAANEIQISTTPVIDVNNRVSPRSNRSSPKRSPSNRQPFNNNYEEIHTDDNQIVLNDLVDHPDHELQLDSQTYGKLIQDRKTECFDSNQPNEFSPRNVSSKGSKRSTPRPHSSKHRKHSNKEKFNEEIINNEIPGNNTLVVGVNKSLSLEEYNYDDYSNVPLLDEVPVLSMRKSSKDTSSIHRLNQVDIYQSSNHIEIQSNSNESNNYPATSIPAA
eukprot:gene20241-26278_t